MAKKIVSVGMLLAANGVDYVEFNTKASLLDWDIILFRPDIHDFMSCYYGMSDYLGKPCLDDPRSFALKEASAHWRWKIKEAVEIGKTVIVHLCKPDDIFVQTGIRNFLAREGTKRPRLLWSLSQAIKHFQPVRNGRPDKDARSSFAPSIENCFPPTGTGLALYRLMRLHSRKQRGTHAS